MFYRTATECLTTQRIELKFNQVPVESERTLQPDSIAEKEHTCSKCERTFNEPKLIQYYACPHCMTKIVEEQRLGCQYWFGYLSQKAKGNPIPKECVECEKVVECLLERNYNSEEAVTAIKKWF